MKLQHPPISRFMRCAMDSRYSFLPLPGGNAKCLAINSVLANPAKGRNTMEQEIEHIDAEQPFVAPLPQGLRD